MGQGRTAWANLAAAHGIAMRTLTALSAVYLVSASAFGVAITLQRNPPLAKALWHGASVANETAVTSADRFAAWGGQFVTAIPSLQMKKAA